MTPIHGKNHTGRRRATAVSLWLALLFFVFAPPAAPAAGEEIHQDSFINEDSSIRDILEELYDNYETVDREIRELEEAVGGLSTEPLLMPLTISVKKQPGFRLISVDIEDNRSQFLTHIYSIEENEAMGGGGRHQLFKGPIRKGRHRLLITYQYTLDGEDVDRSGEVLYNLFVEDDPAHLEMVFKGIGGGVEAKLRRMDFFERWRAREAEEKEEAGESIGENSDSP
ncbi:MAG: hypothetical protein V3W31_10450 [Thermodesulfobacteriota bacterium]